MTTVRAPIAKARRGKQIAGAFFWMGYRESLSYPLGFTVGLLAPLASPVIYFFVGKLVSSSGSVGGDYFTFVAIGLISMQVMTGGLQAFGAELDIVLQQGRFETLLVEPVAWRLIPFGLAAWPIFERTITAFLMGIVAVLLGAHISASAIPVALIVLVLGVASGHAVGVLAASVKVLAKRSDPILSLYTLAANVLSGVVFPVTLLPGPVRFLSYCFPPTYVIAVARRLLMTSSSHISGPSALQGLLLLVVFLVIVYPFALWLYGRALEYGRKVGVLGGY